MPFALGRSTDSDLDIISRISEEELAALYLNIDKLPCVVCNPLRKDSRPSLGWFKTPSGRVRYRDFATGDRGTLLDFLCLYLGVDRSLLSDRILSGVFSYLIPNNKKVISKTKSTSKSTLQVRVRKWMKRDIDYWSAYGISLPWLKWAEVYPITHTIIHKEEKSYVFSCDPLAYAFVEHKDEKSTIKVYQPKNKSGKKWLNKHDKSVLGLWTKVPPTAQRICICSSVKDALCLSSNTCIPAICVQGEGYSISKSACKSLRERYKEIYILFDNDEAGISNGERLATETGFINLILPKVDGAKDISDIYFVWQDKDKFVTFINSIFP